MRWLAPGLYLLCPVRPSCAFPHREKEEEGMFWRSRRTRGYFTRILPSFSFSQQRREPHTRRETGERARRTRSPHIRTHTFSPSPPAGEDESQKEEEKDKKILSLLSPVRKSRISITEAFICHQSQSQTPDNAKVTPYPRRVKSSLMRKIDRVLLFP